MAKTKISEYDSTAANNTDIDSINIAEGMAPSNVNNAIRELMAHLKDGLGAGTPVFLDQTNTRLGVGTSSPVRTLEISGNNNAGAKANYIRITDTDTSATAGNQQGGIEFYTSDSGNENVTASIENLYAGSGAGSELTFNTAPNGSSGVSEAMRIDENGNLLVGTTDSIIWNESATDNSKEGVVIEPKSLQISRYQDTQALFNRQGNDGKNILFAQDGTEVGSIGTPFAGELFIQASGANSSGLLFTSGNSIQPRKNSAADDGNIDLGASGNKFKDLYLSGGAYLGGTGAANYIDDYEEGTWTPVLGGSTSTSGQTYTVQAGKYTKIGNLVHLTAYVSISSIGTVTGSYAYIMDLPFNVADNNNAYPTVNFGYHAAFGQNHNSLHGYVNKGTNFAYITYQNGANLSSDYLSPAGLGSAPSAIFSVTYMTA